MTGVTGGKVSERGEGREEGGEGGRRGGRKEGRKKERLECKCDVLIQLHDI